MPTLQSKTPRSTVLIFIAAVSSILGWSTANATLPEPGLFTEYVANIYQIDGPTTKWLSTPGGESKQELSVGDEIVTMYSDAGYIDLKARSSYSNGLGIDCKSILPPLEFVDDKIKIRSFGNATSRSVLQYTASSQSGSPFPIDLLLMLDGIIGYDLGPGGDPYAFERILDADIQLTVVLHRESGSVTTLWDGGATLIRSEDEDLPLNTYGRFQAEHWTVKATTAELILNEIVEDAFEVEDGETFALEYILSATTRNYEFPNGTAFVKMFNSANYRAISSEVDSKLKFENILKRPYEDRFNEFRGFDSHALSHLYMSADEYPGFRNEIRVVKRPPALFPTAGNYITETVFIPRGTATMAAQDISSFFPNAPGGQLGAKVQVTFFQHDIPTVEERSEFKIWARPSVFSRYIPQFEGGPSENNIADIDMRFSFDGSLMFRARSPNAFEEYLLLERVASAMDLNIYVVLATSQEIFPIINLNIEDDNGDQLKLAPLRDSDPILNQNGDIIGLRYPIRASSDDLVDGNPYQIKQALLEDITFVGDNDYLETFFVMEVGLYGTSKDAELLEYIELDFLHTFTPELSSDTPGVTFALVDPPESRDNSSPLKVQAVDPTEIRISWPSDETNKTLQQAPSLTGENWQDITATIENNGGLQSVTLPVPEGNRYYRLNDESTQGEN